jgi:hypothetical protein
LATQGAEVRCPERSNLSTQRMPRAKRHRPNAPTERRSRPRDEWRTSRDLPPPSALAQSDEFFRSVEGFVRTSRALEHGISEIPVEVVPTVTFADSGLPEWNRHSRHIAAANILLAEGYDALRLRYLWALDVLEVGGVLEERSLVELFRHGRTAFPELNPDTFPMFSREWYAYEVLGALAGARHLVLDADPTKRHHALEAAMCAERLFQQYVVKAVHESAVLSGRATRAGGRKGAGLVNPGRQAAALANRQLWLAYAKTLDPRLSHSAAAKIVARHFHASAETVRKALPKKPW